LNKKLLLFISLLLINVAFSQNKFLNGIVTDTLATALPYANVLAKPIDSTAKITFAFTDEKGRFKLNLQANKTYKVTISYLGFQSVKFKINLKNSASKNIKLIPAINQLNEIDLTQNLPVSVKQDTILYNTNAFTTGKERKLKQILKKLPGVEVDKNGNVTVLGKKVNKLLVDGKTFFDGSTKLGVENIPADAVDKVEVLKNYNEVSFLKGLSDSDRTAMNIKLKKGKKQFTFGDIETGSGTDKHYLVHPNVFYYSPKTNLNFIGDINDIGVKSFTFKDYINFEGGFNRLLSNPNSYFKLSNNSFANFLENKDYKANSNQFGALNFNQTINDKLSISSYAIFSKSKISTQNTSTNQYLSENDNTIETRDDQGKNNQTFFLSKFFLENKPSLNTNFSYSSYFKSSTNKAFNKIASNYLNKNTNLNTFINNNGINFKQNIQWHKRFSIKHTLSLSLNYHYSTNKPTSNWQTNQPILTSLLPLQNEAFYHINQQKKLSLNNLSFLLKHYWILNNTHHLYTTLGNNYLHEKYFTDTYQKLTDGVQNNFMNAGFDNNLNFKLNDLYLGLQFKMKTGIVIIKTGVFTHYYSLSTVQNTKEHLNKLVWLPELLTKVDFSDSEHLSFKYNLKSDFADAPKYAPNLELVNYNTVFKGNTKLDNELFHSARLRYSRFSLYHGIIMSASLGFTKKLRSIKNKILLVGINQFNTPVITKNPDNSWTLSSNIRKTISKFILKLKGFSIIENYLQTINNQKVANKSSSNNFGIELGSNFKKWPNLEFGLNKGFSKFTIDHVASKFTSINPYFNIEISLLKNFDIVADYNRTNYKDNFNQINKYEIANASLSYHKEDGVWSFKLSGTNIFGASFKQKNSYSDFLISDTKTFILPRIWLFTVTYKI